MSMMRCDHHGAWDSDNWETCPACSEIVSTMLAAPVSPLLPGLEPIAWMYDVCNDGLNAFTQSKREVSMWPDKSKVVPVYTAEAIRAEISRLLAGGTTEPIQSTTVPKDQK